MTKEFANLIIEELRAIRAEMARTSEEIRALRVEMIGFRLGRRDLRGSSSNLR